MNLKKLEKANNVLQEIKKLDAQIIEIDKKALLIANGEVKISLNLNIEDLAKKQEEESKVQFDEDGSLLKGHMSISWDTIMGMSGLRRGSEKKEEKKDDYTSCICENTALQILGVLLGELHLKRTALIQQLQKMGVAI